MEHRASTVLWYRHRLAGFLRMHGSKDMSEIVLDDVRAYIVGHEQCSRRVGSPQFARGTEPLFCFSSIEGAGWGLI
jgi:metallophosphoesterase superfamily enzyme